MTVKSTNNFSSQSMTLIAGKCLFDEYTFSSFDGKNSDIGKSDEEFSVVLLN